jgi:Ran GTPase-activating protein (RanGAP) involved in mRNA processing and transport
MSRDEEQHSPNRPLMLSLRLSSKHRWTMRTPAWRKTRSANRVVLSMHNTARAVGIDRDKRRASRYSTDIVTPNQDTTVSERKVKSLHALLDRVFVHGSAGVGSLIMAFHGQNGRSGRQPWYMLSLVKKDWRSLHRFEASLCVSMGSFVTYADLSRFPSLQSLGISHTAGFMHRDMERKGRAVIEKLCHESLAHTPNLHTLNLSNSHLMKYPSAVRLLSEHGLPRIRNLHALDLGFNSIGPEVICNLSKAGLRHVSNLHTLELRWNLLGDEGLSLLSEFGLAHVPNLRTLDLESNRIGDAGVQALSEVGFAHVPRLHTLNLGCNRIGEEGLGYLSVGLGRVPELRTLILSGNGSVGDIGVKALAEIGLEKVPSLTCLDLSWINLKQYGTRVLCESGLVHVKRLQKLDLSGNGLGPEGVRELSHMGLQHVPELQSLKLGSNYLNDVRDRGLKVLSEVGLRKVPMLRVLDLVSSRVGDEGVCALSPGLRHVGQLRTLMLRSNRITAAGAMALVEGVRAHVPRIQTLDLGYNCIGPVGVTLTRTVLTSLNVPDLLLSAEDVTRYSQRLEQESTLAGEIPRIF